MFDGGFAALLRADEDWLYVRTASMVRKIYIRKGMGVGAFRRWWCGFKAVLFFAAIPFVVPNPQELLWCHHAKSTWSVFFFWGRSMGASSAGEPAPTFSPRVPERLRVTFCSSWRRYICRHFLAMKYMECWVKSDAHVTILTMRPYCFAQNCV